MGSFTAWCTRLLVECNKGISGKPKSPTDQLKSLPYLMLRTRQALDVMLDFQQQGITTQKGLSPLWSLIFQNNALRTSRTPEVNQRSFQCRTLSGVQS